jgi:ketol-acid reductoisomerase
MRVYFDADADPALIRGRNVAVVGYGNQGRAQALNLRDSGVAVTVGLPKSSASRDRAAADGLAVMTAAEACGEADVAVMLAADEDQARIYQEEIAQALRPAARSSSRTGSTSTSS